MKQFSLLFLIVFCFFNLTGFASKGDRIFISDAKKEKSEKEAILILPGFGAKRQGTDSMVAFFFHKEYDVFIPDYIARKSIAHCVKNLNEFVTKHDLNSYKKMHVFTYIIGAWTLNNWIMEHPNNNISDIIYDRSPIQERTPYALMKENSFLVQLYVGKLIKEFSKTDYLPNSNDKIKIGIFIENKATKLAHKKKTAVMSLGPIDWDVKNLNQSHEDFCYLPLDHDDMYKCFAVFGEEILYFFKNHHFSDTVNRIPDLTDPFSKF